MRGAATRGRRACATVMASLLSAAMAPGLHDLQQSMRRSLIMGGEAVNGGPHPWVVSLQHRNFHFCGGTLLDEWHVLTAAHCETHVRCTGDTCEGVDVNIRRHNISLLAEDEFPGCSVVLRSALWVSHPQYSGSPRHLHDIAIIHLRDPVPDVAVGCRPYGLMRTTFVDLLQRPLRRSNVRAGSPVQAVGWGRMWPDGPSSPALLDTPMRAILASECRRAWHSILGQQQICGAGGSNGETRDVCNGDSGGPLISPGTNVQVGVVSYSHKCGTPGAPSVFTDPRTADHNQWIRNNVQCLSQPNCCPYPTTSDGDVSDSEECDDGNTVAGDGCFCGLLEPGYFCQGSPSTCVLCAEVPPAPPPAGMRACADTSPECGAWAQRGECRTNPRYMNAACALSCNSPGCWVDTRPHARAAFLRVETVDLQSTEDYSWEVKQRLRPGEPEQFVQNLGEGDGFLICMRANEAYELHVNSDRWNSSAGFSIVGATQQPIVQVPAWTGLTTSLVFTIDGLADDVQASAVETDSCVNIQIYNPLDPGSPPSIVANSPAVFGRPEFSLGLTEYIWAVPAKGCGDSLANSDAVRGKIVIMDRGDCFFVHKANVAQEAGAAGLLVVNYDDATNRGLTIAMGAASDSSRQLDNVCCVDIPLAMVTSSTGRQLHEDSGLQVSMSASECYSAPDDCPVVWVGRIKPGCGSCAPGTTLDCNEVCRPSEKLGDGHCDIGAPISGATNFACSEHGWDEGDCPRDECEDDPSWRDPLGRACSDEQYSAVPGACGDYEESYDKCRRTCHTCVGACNALYDTVADQGTATSCAKISFVFGVGCDDIEAAGIDCTHARYCGYCSGERPACAPGWQLDCNGICAPVAWVGDGACDDGRTTAFNLNCRAGGFYDGGDCGQRTLPAGCSYDGTSVLALGATHLSQEVSMTGGYGDLWDCKWEITCAQGSAFYVAFQSFDTEESFDSLSIYAGPAASLQLNAPSQQQCRGLRDTRVECATWAMRGECEANVRFMSTACAESCAGCGTLSIAESVWSGHSTLPHTQTVSRGQTLTLRFSTDSNTQADGFAFSYACGDPPAEQAPCASAPCANGGTCFESNDADGFWCSCVFGFDGPLCTDALSLETRTPNDCGLQIAEVAEQVSTVCCGPLDCDEGVPAQCSAECAEMWIPIVRTCGAFLSEYLTQMADFTTSCEVTEYGNVKRRCPPSVWQAGVSAVLSACCPRGDFACANDITRLPTVCPASGSCARLVEELYSVCHEMVEQRQPAAHQVLFTLFRSCQEL